MDYPDKKIIRGFGISGYRSFGKDIVQIRDLEKVNVFVGKNNSGKSNILRFCQKLFELEYNSEQHKSFMHTDYCKDLNSKEIIFEILLDKKIEHLNRIYDKIVSQRSELKLVAESGNAFWLRYKAEANQGRFSLIGRKYDIAHMNLTQRSIDLEIYKNDIRQGMQHFRCGHHSIEAKRQIQKLVTEEKQTSPPKSIVDGAGLIERIFNLCNPEEYEEAESKDKMARIANLLKDILNKEDITIRVPRGKDKILVTIDDKTLPLENLGTGIHELVLMAAYVTYYDNEVFCIEEPEIHMHPELQKKFIKYLLYSTNNQYLIASHSSAFFDMFGVNIYHCKLEDGFTVCDLVKTNAEKFVALEDMGYRPSDLLLSNFVIWVEGPSDRIYINHWIKSQNGELVEGVHYSIMFYGGSLLKHLTYETVGFEENDEISRVKIDEFISLAKLNRNTAIVMDSDKEYAQTPLNETKKRIIAEFETKQCLAWVTKGREIENYISIKVYKEALNAVHPRIKKDFIADAESKYPYGDLTKNIDKMEMAKKIAELPLDYTVLDLNRQINMLIERIKKANDMK